MSDGRFKKENTAANGTAGSGEVRVDRAALIEAFGLIDDKYIDEAREPYDTVLPVKAAASAETADNGQTAGRNTSAGLRSGSKGSAQRTRRLTVWFTSAAAVLVLAFAITAIVLRNTPKKQSGLALVDENGQVAAVDQNSEHYDDDEIPKPSTYIDEPTSVSPLDDNSPSENSPSDNNPTVTESDKVPSQRDDGKEFSGYGIIDMNEPSYQAAELADAADIVLAGIVVGTTYEIVDGNGDLVTWNASAHEDCMLYTVYDVAVTKFLKIPEHTEVLYYNYDDPTLKDIKVRIAVPGGRNGVDVEEQLAVMQAAGYGGTPKVIPVIPGLKKIYEGATYVFFLNEFGSYCAPVTTAQYAQPSDVEGSDWQSFFIKEAPVLD